MGEPTRYDVSDAESGLTEGVLKNKLNLKSQSDLNEAETVLLKDSYEYYLSVLEEEDLTFDIQLLFSIHKHFLYTLYTWAGKLRTVNISKEDALFVPAAFLTNAITEFEQILEKQTPKTSDTKKQFCQKLSIIHAEFNVIHPFREGNGRTIRLFMDLMAAQYGYDLINWSGVSKTHYIQACREGMSKKYETLREILWNSLNKSKT
jgi:cell filamentation protein